MSIPFNIPLSSSDTVAITICPPASPSETVAITSNIQPSSNVIVTGTSDITAAQSIKKREYAAAAAQ